MFPIVVGLGVVSPTPAILEGPQTPSITPVVPDESGSAVRAGEPLRRGPGSQQVVRDRGGYQQLIQP